MRVSIVASHIYRPDNNRLNKTTTGLAIILNDIISNFSSDLDILYCTTIERIPKYNKKNFTTIDTRSFSLLKRVRVMDIMSCIHELYHRIPIKKIIKNEYSKLITREFVRGMSVFEPDVVNIHDLSKTNLEIIKICIEKKIPCVLTLHMYIGNEYEIEELSEYKDLSDLERKFFEEYTIPITVVSSGLKRRILNDYNGIDPDRIKVISNGIDLSTDYRSKDDSTDIARKYPGKKLFLCIGTICKRKNQEQLLKSLNMLSQETQEKIKVLFIGKDLLGARLQDIIREKKMENIAEVVGEVTPTALRDYYRAGYAVISTSLNEAFGLTFIEGFGHGKPSIMFEYIDAISELYNEDAVVLIKGKDDSCIVSAIDEAVNKSWNEALIKEHGNKFDIKYITKKYEKYYFYVSGKAE